MERGEEKEGRRKAEQSNDLTFPLSNRTDVFLEMGFVAFICLMLLALYMVSDPFASEWQSRVFT